MPRKQLKKSIYKRRRNPDINTIDDHFSKAFDHLLAIYNDLAEDEKEELEDLSKKLNRFKIKLYSRYWRSP